MLARLSRSLPTGADLFYEPKWDGFRCLAFCDGGRVELQSRNQRRLGRYFPEIVAALSGLSDVAVDGELLVTVDDRFDFGALMARLHPAASRVERLRQETPATYVVFDMLAIADTDLRPTPFAERRRALAHALAGASAPLLLTPTTRDAERAAGWLERPSGEGIDGVMVKGAATAYDVGKRTMTKVKRQRTIDTVVAGFRWLPDRPEPSSLLLGLYDDCGGLGHVGVA